MGAPKGNQFWKLAKNIGRPRIFKSPQQLQTACLKYFQWVADNPIYATEVVRTSRNDEGYVLAEVPKLRAMTIGGLCIFLNIDVKTWESYSRKKEFVPITTRVEERIRTQKIEGTAAGLLNANIIAREMQLPDVSRIGGEKNGDPIQIEDLAMATLMKKIFQSTASQRAMPEPQQAILLEEDGSDS